MGEDRQPSPWSVDSPPRRWGGEWGGVRGVAAWKGEAAQPVGGGAVAARPSVAPALDARRAAASACPLGGGGSDSDTLAVGSGPRRRAAWSRTLPSAARGGGVVGSAGGGGAEAAGGGVVRCAPLPIHSRKRIQYVEDGGRRPSHTSLVSWLRVDRWWEACSIIPGQPVSAEPACRGKQAHARLGQAQACCEGRQSIGNTRGLEYASSCTTRTLWSIRGSQSVWVCL